MKLKNKLAFITGGGRGIGRAIAVAFAGEGASIVVAARTREEIDNVASEVAKQFGANSFAVKCNVGDTEKVARAFNLRCEMFIDDLPEILAMPGFPQGMRKILFDPENQFAGATGHGQKLDRHSSWAAISADLTCERA